MSNDLLFFLQGALQQLLAKIDLLLIGKFLPMLWDQ